MPCPAIVVHCLPVATTAEHVRFLQQLMQALKAAAVEFIVAPFEADAQMAYLAINGLVHAVSTEDSDLLPYGCPRVSNQHSSI